MPAPETIAVLGAGSWGTALAMVLGRNGHHVRLWDRDRLPLDAIAAHRENSPYLPGLRLPDTVIAEPDFKRALHAITGVVVAVPSTGFRTTVQALHPFLSAQTGMVWASKGLELPDGKLLHQVLGEELDTAVPRALISGPSFAREVAERRPTAVTLACPDAVFARTTAGWFHGETFRVYTSADVPGVEIGGALKNVLAIAAGISDGLGFGANARAALITRGLHELVQLGERAGAKRETLSGLAGLGDLVLTCTDNQSRNRRMGLALAAGAGLEEALRTIGQAVEGVETARVIQRLAALYGVQMPICQQVYRVLYENLPPKLAVSELLSRDPRAESG